MPDLEQRLHALAADVTWPETPDLAAAVTAALQRRGTTEPPPRWFSRPSTHAWRRRRLILAIAAALLLLPAAALALPGPRHAILDALGLRHVAVERVERPPRGAAPTDLTLGTRTPPGRVARAAGFVPFTPRALGRPDRAFVLGSVVTYVYEPEHLLLAQAPGGFDREIVLEKILHVDDQARRVRVAGAPGIWLSRPHAYGWSDATGPPVRSGPALVWERHGRVLRLEGPRTLDQALRIARSVR